ncbi:hypothetical protein K501DRAFT_338119 [Backusella circina FSU 941]|nr:hypothetical protein K501DRAFT_338119 [Backusella circina FSU 941]
MGTFINIQVTFDKPYQFNLLRENLNWQQLSIVIQSSIPEAANKETLSLYYTLNDETQTISTQDHLSQLLGSVTIDMLGVRLYGQTQEDMESVFIMPRFNDAFKQLSDFVDLHYNQLKANPCLSKMIGFLAARVVYAPEKPIDEELNQIEEWISRGVTMDRGEFKRMMKERKMMWKQGHRKVRNKMDDEESFEFVGSDSNHGRRHRRHGHLGVPINDASPDNEKNVSHEEDKHSDPSSESESGKEGGHRRGGRCGRRGKHHGHPFGPAAAEFFTRFGGGYRNGRHGFGGPGFDGPGFGGEYHHHPHGRREDASDTDFDTFPRGFGRKGHHDRHGKKHDKYFGGEKYFVFA